MSELQYEALLAEGWMAVIIFAPGFLAVPAGFMFLLHVVRASRLV